MMNNLSLVIRPSLSFHERSIFSFTLFSSENPAVSCSLFFEQSVNIVFPVSIPEAIF